MGVGTDGQRPFGLWCALVGGLAMAPALALASGGPPVPVTELAVLVALCVFAEHMVVRHPNGAALSGSVVVALAAVFVFRHSAPLLGPLLVGLAGGLYFPHLRRGQWLLMFFNAGNFGLSTLSAAAAYQVVAGTTTRIVPSLLGAIAAGLAYCAVNVSIVGIGLHFRHRMTFASLVPTLWGVADLQIIVFATVGVFLGRLYDHHGLWVPVLFVLPILVARQAYAAYLAMQEAREATLDVLIECLEAKDPYTAGHVRRVATFACYIGSEFGQSSGRLRRLREAALMHDLGKLIIPNQLLNKPGRLTASEYARVRHHEVISVDLLAGIDLLASNTNAVTDYGLDASLEGRIVHVADAFDAMTSTRAYRKAMSHDDAVAELRANAGIQFDRQCVESLITALERVGERYGAGVESSAAARRFGVEPPLAGAGSAGLGDLAPEPA
ncbi:MAG: HD domain-containing phosphohydrolase [Acidimicrobiia bacterium]